MRKLEKKQCLISRRKIITASASALVIPAPLLFGQTDNTAQPYGGLPIGLHGATLKKFSIEQIVRILVESLQIHRLELTPGQIRLRSVTQGSNQGPVATIREVQALRNTLQSAAIIPTGYGPIALNNNETINRELFDLASELGVRNITCIPELEHLDHLEELADEYQLRLAIHNNAPGRSFSKTSTVVDALTNRGPNIGACLDVGNAIRASEDPAKALLKLSPKVYGIHLKSVSSRSPDSEVVELGTGLLNTDTFFQALQEINLIEDAALSLEYLAQPDQPIPGILRSLALLETAMSAK